MPQRKDRRIHKTEALLRTALASLMREKPYDRIVVKEILARANVGRSTFYTHFSDKDELLRNCIDSVLDATGPHARPTGRRSPDDLLWFSLPIYEHIEDHRRSGEAGMGEQGRRAMHEHLEAAIVDLIEADVSAAVRAERWVGATRPELLVRWIAATFVQVLNWWIESASRLTAREADSLFRGLVEPAIANALGSSVADPRSRGVLSRSTATNH